MRELIGKLDGLAERVVASDHTRKSRTSHEVARTRADALAWVAYDPAAAGAPLRKVDVEAGTGPDQPADNAAQGVIRAWALRRAYEVCEAQHQRDFYLEFTRAECAKALGLSGARVAFEEVTRMLVAEAGKHRETRREAELAQVAAICHAQLGSMPSDAEAAQGERRDAATATASKAAQAEHRNAARAAASKAAETARGLSHTEVTIFSALRRHNISPEAFTREVSDLIGARNAGGQADGAQAS